MTNEYQEEPVELVPMQRRALERLAARQPVALDLPVAERALPPLKTVARSLAQLDAGVAPVWCKPFLIVSPARAFVIGGCGFKGAPIAGDVEIYYGIAPTERRRGIATTAVQRLLKVAVANGATRVIAHIIDGNLASAKTVQRLGFAAGMRFSEVEGADVVPWSWTVG